VVAAGLRVRYSGTELERGGIKICLHEPTHGNLNGYDEAAIDAVKQSRRVQVNREWTTVLYRPVRTEDLAYRDSIAGPTATSASASTYFMGVLVAAPSSTAISLEYEFFVLHEYQGSTVRGQTPTHVDPTGAAAVMYTAQSSRALQPSNTSDAKRQGDMINEVSKYVVKGVSHAVHHYTQQQKKPPANDSSSGSFWSTLGNIAMAILPEIVEAL
jgi:hypothetical protein